MARDSATVEEARANRMEQQIKAKKEAEIAERVVTHPVPGVAKEWRESSGSTQEAKAAERKAELIAGEIEGDIRIIEAFPTDQ